MFDTGIDRGTMSSIFLIDDLDNAVKTGCRSSINMLLLSQNIKIERCILILGINIEPDDLADLRKSINRLDVYCAASSG